MFNSMKLLDAPSSTQQAMLTTLLYAYSIEDETNPQKAIASAMVENPIDDKGNTWLTALGESLNTKFREELLTKSYDEIDAYNYLAGYLADIIEMEPITAQDIMIAGIESDVAQLETNPRLSR